MAPPVMPCPHGRQRSKCKDCGCGHCEHRRRPSRCKDCGGSGICDHGRRRSQCKDCGGSSICEHGRRRSRCKECGGGGICEHGRVRGECKDCGGSSICEHGRRCSQCKECSGGSGHVTTLEATAVEVFDEEEEPHELLPTVQSHLVVAARPRGGKRKRTGAMTSDAEFRLPAQYRAI